MGKIKMVRRQMEITYRDAALTPWLKVAAGRKLSEVRIKAR